MNCANRITNHPKAEHSSLDECGQEAKGCVCAAVENELVDGLISRPYDIKRALDEREAMHVVVVDEAGLTEHEPECTTDGHEVGRSGPVADGCVVTELDIHDDPPKSEWRPQGDVGAPTTRDGLYRLKLKVENAERRFKRTVDDVDKALQRNATAFAEWQRLVRVLSQGGVR